MDWVAKILFPTHNRDLRRREMRWLTRVVLLTVLFCAALGAAVYFMSKGK